MAAPLIEIRVSRAPGERRVALLVDGVAQGFRVERPARPDGVGDLVKGRVLARMAALSGAFVALPEGEGFLPANACPGRALPSEGTVLTLRVTRAAQGGKGARVAVHDAELPGEGMLARGPDQALRWAAAHPGARVLADDAAEVARLRAALGAARVELGEAFDDALEALAESLESPEVPLPGAGRLIVSPLPALTAVDVDSGGADPAAVNRAAVIEFGRQLRLRDLAGAILLDVAGLTAKRRAALEPALRAALAGDALLRYLGLGPLGLFEMTRARIHPPLHEVWGDRALARGLALLRRAAREARAGPARRLALHAPRGVLEALRALPGALAEYETGAGRALVLVESPREEIADA
jgi:Ribonuclease G/E